MTDATEEKLATLRTLIAQADTAAKDAQARAVADEALQDECAPALTALQGTRIGFFEDFRPCLVVAIGADFTPWLKTARAAAAVVLTDLTDTPGPISCVDSPLALTTDAAMTDTAPTVGTDAADTFTTSPSLPAGLSIAGATGVISGTPSAAVITVAAAEQVRLAPPPAPFAQGNPAGSAGA